MNGIVPEEHPVWTKNGWKVFLDNPEEVWPRIRYVEGNPMKEGLPEQYWPFVVPYDNWPFHKGGAKPQAKMLRDLSIACGLASRLVPFQPPSTSGLR